MEQREKLGSRLGFILLSAGCAIGVGNVWKFPYITGQYGGGTFVLVYLVFLLAMGIPRGRAVGLLLQRLLDAVVDGTVSNEREALVQYAQYFSSEAKTN